MAEAMVYVLLHYDEVIGVYTTRMNAERGKTEGHVKALDPRGRCVQEWRLDGFPHAATATK